VKKQQIEQVVAELPEDVDHLIEQLHLLDKQKSPDSN